MSFEEALEELVISVALRVWLISIGRSSPTLQLVVGGPGAGKTEFLVRRALWLLEDADIPPEEILGVELLKARSDRS